jgi:hypothetical protein
LALTYDGELLLTNLTCLTSAAICGKNVTPAGAPGNYLNRPDVGSSDAQWPGSAEPGLS